MHSFIWEIRVEIVFLFKKCTVMVPKCLNRYHIFLFQFSTLRKIKKLNSESIWAPKHLETLFILMQHAFISIFFPTSASLWKGFFPIVHIGSGQLVRD